MKTIRDFLTAYADRYPDKIQDRDKFINETNHLYIDYADGVFAFGIKRYVEDKDHSDKYPTITDITGSGGHNGDIMEDEEYFYLWDNFIRTCSEFVEWYEGFKLSHLDFMVIQVDFYNREGTLLGDMEVSTEFVFYGNPKECIRDVTEESLSKVGRIE